MTGQSLIYSPALQISPGSSTRRSAQTPVVITGGQFVGASEFLAHVFPFLILDRQGGDGNSLFLGELGYRFREREILCFHNEVDDVAPPLAAETMVKLPGRVNRKGRGFLTVKRT